jgi:hypothetical protein
MLLYLLLLATSPLASAFSITFKNYITDERVPKVSFYLTMGNKEPQMVASSIGFRETNKVDVTSTLSGLSDNAEYTGTEAFTIQMRPANPIQQLAEESQSEFEKYSQPVLSSKTLSEGFGSQTEGVLWLGVGTEDEYEKAFHMVWTDVFKGSQDCTEDTKTTDCFVINIKAQTANNVNSDSINFNTAADENENLLAGQHAIRKCRVGKENIAINNAGSSFRIYPEVACGDPDLMYVFSGDRKKSAMYALKLEGPGSSASALSASFGLVLLGILFNLLQL